MFERHEDESGTALIVLLLVLLPVAMVFGGFAMAMHGRDTRLDEDVTRERCFWAAEAGVDDAMHKASSGVLGRNAAYTVDMGAGLACDVRAVNIGFDGRDNDRDRQVDEPDEDLIEVHSVGRYRSYEREIATWLGRVTFLPRFNAAATITSPRTDIMLGGTPETNGNNFNLDNTPGNPALSQHGISIMEPGTTGDLSSRLTGREPGMVMGVGGSPSLSTTPAFDVPALVAAARNSANLVLSNNRYSGLQFGDAPSSGFITYRDGDLNLSGNSLGAGVLVVTGNLVLSGTFRFEGVVIVLGSLTSGVGTAEIYGALVLGPDARQLRTYGDFHLRYCDEAIRFADSLLGRYSNFNGWQELAR